MRQQTERNALASGQRDRGQLLLLAPWEHHNEHIVISRNQCLSLNEMAKKICKEATRQLL